MLTIPYMFISCVLPCLSPTNPCSPFLLLPFLSVNYKYHSQASLHSEFRLCCHTLCSLLCPYSLVVVLSAHSYYFTQVFPVLTPGDLVCLSTQLARISGGALIAKYHYNCLSRVSIGVCKELYLILCVLMKSTILKLKVLFT